MGLCTVDYVKLKIHYSTLEDIEVSDLIAEVTEEILAQCETTDESNPLVILAVKYAVLASVLMKLKTTDELTASVETPGAKFQHTTDKDIDLYEQKSKYYIEKVRQTNSTSYSSPSYCAGFNCTGDE